MNVLKKIKLHFFCPDTIALIFSPHSPNLVSRILNTWGDHASPSQNDFNATKLFLAGVMRMLDN